MLRAGTVLAGRYRLDQRVGSGGMGEVWRAVDLVLGRTVAVKCLLHGSPEELSFVSRFRAEARIMATISHPGVVEVYDFGDDPAAGVYLVMKFIEGESLAQALGRVGRLNPAATMRLVAEAADALHAAHEKGVTHRDVKPGNLLLRTDGSTLVTDFGIARSTDGTGHTATGSLVGTAGYIAPERAMGHPATPASDVYALGIVAYRCLAGQVPFPGDSVVEIAMRHVHDEPPPLPADVPPGVRALVARAMAKDPALRWPSGAVLAHEARRVSLRPEPVTVAVPTRPEPTSAVPTRPQGTVPVPTRDHQVVRRRRRRSRALVPALVAVVLVAAAAIGIGLSGSDPERPQSLGESPAASTASPATSAVAVQASPVAAATPSPGVPTAVPSAGVPSLKAGAGAATTSLTAPGNLTATPISASTIRLRWSDRSTGEKGFTVIDGATSHDVGANVTTFDWTGLAPSAYTCFKVRAFDASGVSAYHPAAQGEWVCAVSLDGSGPTAPTGLTAAAVDSGTVHLEWVDNSADEAGFTVINGSTSRNVGAGTTSYDWSGLAPGTYMCFKVRAFNAAGVSAYDPAATSAWVCVTTPTA
ncbi:hypothetical protein Cs7R123_11290 [Catellatospora sp. TT07R-123]|uniref:protein kinase domain-containing protein n=1 Tax=Catellatospora sp. TT07R-123 TaxID=2733863 RepID=UPI001B2992D1|nr:hypothetical protein Cs7R123_11290 [Catellatospora sp. TT07R-123]